MRMVEFSQLVRKELSSEQLSRAVIYLDPRPLRVGESVGVGPEAPEMPFDGTLVFVDLAPNYNWAHPCLLLLVREDAGELRTVEASFPPRGRGFPGAFQVLVRQGQDVPWGEEPLDGA